MRTWINLPDVPSELLEPARHDDDLNVQQRRREVLFRHFGGSVETREEAEKLVFSLAAVFLPAFRETVIKLKKKPGRPPAINPKYEIPFLWQVAQLFDSYNKRLNRQSETPLERVYEKFLDKYPDIRDKLRLTGKNHSLGTFQVLLRIGRKGYLNMVRLYMRPYIKSMRQFDEVLAVEPTGLKAALNPVVVRVFDGLRRLDRRKTQFHFNEHTVAVLILHQDLESEAGQKAINTLCDFIEAALEEQERNGVKSPIQRASLRPIDPLRLLKKRLYLRPHRKSDVALALRPTGLKSALNPVVAGVFDGLRHLDRRTTRYHFNEHTVEMLLHQDPESETGQKVINKLYDFVEAALEEQERNGVQSPLQMASLPPIDPLRLMKQNGKFKSCD